MFKLVIISCVFMLLSCKKEHGIKNLVHGTWNIETLERNGESLYSDFTSDSGSGFVVPSKLFINLENNDFFIEVDPYKKKFIRGDIFLNLEQETNTLTINNSDNFQLVGKYKMEIDTISINKSNDVFRMYLLSEENTFIIALKSVVKPLL